MNWKCLPWEKLVLKPLQNPGSSSQQQMGQVTPPSLSCCSFASSRLSRSWGWKSAHLAAEVSVPGFQFGVQYLFGWKRTAKSNGKPLAKQLSNCQEVLPVFEIFIEESWTATTCQHTPAVVLEKIFYVPIPKLGHEQKQTSSSPLKPGPPKHVSGFAIRELPGTTKTRFLKWISWEKQQIISKSKVIKSVNPGWQLPKEPRAPPMEPTKEKGVATTLLASGYDYQDMYTSICICMCIYLCQNILKICK